jgi:hypothetical protein
MPKQHCIRKRIKSHNRLNNQIVSDAGMYYVSYRLSLHGWNVMPTARNARGIDLVIYSQDCATTHTIQVKSLASLLPVPLGKRGARFLAESVIICAEVVNEQPRCFILTRAEAEGYAQKNSSGRKISYWLPRKNYICEEYENQWCRIGTGYFLSAGDP